MSSNDLTDTAPDHQAFVPPLACEPEATHGEYIPTPAPQPSPWCYVPPSTAPSTRRPTVTLEAEPEWVDGGATASGTSRSWCRYRGVRIVREQRGARVLFRVAESSFRTLGEARDHVLDTIETGTFICFVDPRDPR